MDQIWPEGFVCDCCLKEQNARRKDNRFSAKSKILFLFSKSSNYVLSFRVIDFFKLIFYFLGLSILLID